MRDRRSADAAILVGLVGLVIGATCGLCGCKTRLIDVLDPNTPAPPPLPPDLGPRCVMGALQFKQHVDVKLDPISPLVVGDWNLDGRSDVAVGGFAKNRSVTMVLGGGDGTLMPQAPVPTNYEVSDLATGDFNLDGKPDLVFEDWLNPDGPAPLPQLTVLLGDGAGGVMGKESSMLSFPARLGVFSHSQAADLNHDGKLDVVATLNTTNLLVAIGAGDGTFSTVGVHGGWRTASVAVVALADWNGDGHVDIAAPYADPVNPNDRVEILQGDGLGGFASGSVTQLGGSNAVNILAADLNNDKNPDLVIATYSNTGLIDVLLGDGAGGFVDHVITLQGRIANLAAGDLNGDGVLDLAVSDEEYSRVDLLVGRGDGSYEAPIGVPAGGPILLWNGLAIANMNNDCRLDLVITREDGTVSVLRNTSQ